MNTVNGRVVEAALGVGFLTGRSATSSGPRSPLAGHPGQAYNSVSTYPGSKFPESSFELVVPRLLSNHSVTNLVLQSPTSDVTNLSQLPESQHQDLIKQSARNMLAVMERARAEHSSLRKVIILDQLPRADSDHLSHLASIYNTTLRDLVAAALPSNQCQMLVAAHPSLQPTSQATKSALFGSPSARSSDGIHFRGKEGNKRHTSSVISAIKSVGLDDWTVQGRLGAASQRNDQTYSQAVGTSNQFARLN